MKQAVQWKVIRVLNVAHMKQMSVLFLAIGNRLSSKSRIED